MSDPAALRAEILARILQERGATEWDPTSSWYPSMDLAAIAALDAITDATREQGGLIFRNTDGLFGYSVPVPGDRDDFSLRARFDSQQMSPAGIYHTHPAGLLSDVFSANDVETAQRMKLISYIKALQDGQIRRFDPATSRLRRTMERGLRNQSRLRAQGEIVERTAKGLLE